MQKMMLNVKIHFMKMEMHQGIKTSLTIQVKNILHYH